MTRASATPGRLIRSRPALAALTVLVIAGAAAGAIVAASGGNGAKSGQAPPPGSAPAATSSAFKATVAPGQLSVAEELGPDIVTARVVELAGRLELQVNTLSGLEQRQSIPIRLPQATTIKRCGVGCSDASVPASTPALTVDATIGGTPYTARLPIQFRPGDDQLAQTLLNHVDQGQANLHTAVVNQSLAGSPSPPELTVFEVEAPDRFAYQLSLSGRPLGATIIVGTREWSRTPGQRLWQASTYGSPGQPGFSASSYLDWWAASAGSPRLLDLHQSGSTRIADIAALSEVPLLGPVWFRLHVDVTHDRLLRLRMITADHFMTQTWGAFNSAVQISRPADTTAVPRG